MFARVSTILGKPQQVEDGIRHYKDQTIPAAKKMAGFKQAILLVNREKGKSVGITFWDTEQNMQASAAAANQLRAQASQTAGTDQPPTVEIFEVAAQVIEH